MLSLMDVAANEAVALREANGVEATCKLRICFDCNERVAHFCLRRTVLILQV